MLFIVSIITLFIAGNVAARYIGDLWFVPNFDPTLIILLGCYVWIFPLFFYWNTWTNMFVSRKDISQVVLLCMFLLACVNFGEIFTNGHNVKDCVVQQQITDDITIEWCRVGPSAAALFQVSKNDIRMRFLRYME